MARVELGSRSYSSDAILNESECAGIAIFQLPGANALSTMDQVKTALKQLSKQFPKDMAYNVNYDTTKYIRTSIDELVETLLIAVLLVILVVFVFLQDWRATMIPAIAVPVSLIGTFAAMKVVGFSINITTLFGLILAIGIVVDDAIIVVENVYRLMHDEGLDPKAAAIKTMDQVSGPIVSTTMVLLSVVYSGVVFAGDHRRAVPAVCLDDRLFGGNFGVERDDLESGVVRRFPADVGKTASRCFRYVQPRFSPGDGKICRGGRILCPQTGHHGGFVPGADRVHGLHL